MASHTNGEKWIKFLRAYGPLPEGNSQEAENISSFSAKLGIPRLAFPHPMEENIKKLFVNKENKKVAVVLGTAGDGKTTVCLNLVETMSGKPADPTCTSQSIETFQILPEFGGGEMTMIYDVTAWRQKSSDSTLMEDQVHILEKAAQYAAGKGGAPFMIAVNDGQLHETVRALPADSSPELRAFFDELLQMHSSNCENSLRHTNLVMVNLSTVPSHKLMEMCLDGILSRPEWACIQDENDTALFGPNSSIVANYHLLKTESVRHRLISLARVADASGYHLPTRSIIMLLVNVLLGHPDFPNQLVKPGVETARNFKKDRRYKAALHKNLFGMNFKPAERKKRVLFEFLGNLRVGEETTNDIDQLIIFGKEHPDFQQAHEKLIGTDPFDQRDPELPEFLSKYLRGEVSEEKEIERFRELLSDERKRLFVHASLDQFEFYNLWVTCIFHHAGHLIDKILSPIQNGEEIKEEDKLKLIAGLNRVWTGLLVRDDSECVHISTGLDTTTSPISDLLIKKIDSYTDSQIQVRSRQADGKPEFVMRCGTEEFAFELTMLRFEFLMRVAKGAMPLSFSSEIYSNFQALKQKTIHTLKLKPNPKFMLLMDLDNAGSIQETRINLR
jgi:hypothetical protein